MPTFKVVLDGIDLSPDQSQRISKAIQRSVLHELADLDTQIDDAGKAEPLSFALLPVTVGQTMGLVATEPPDSGRLGEIVTSEFGG
jgi:hypothetical protein